jgi:nucleoside-diphosphate-sugar epimerase
MKIAVIGTTGFLGSLLENKLKNDFEILPVTRKTLNISSYRDVQNWLEQAKPNYIINCAISGGGATVDDFIPEHIVANIDIFLNFYNSEFDFKYINIGSGAEFNRRYDIDLAEESQILTRRPKSSYGYAKNVIARMCLTNPNFYTLRLFGCFDNSEPDTRFFKQLIRSQQFHIRDRYFDFISADDFVKILKFYLNQNFVNVPKDVNCVYYEKYKLSEIADKFIKMHNLNTEIVLDIPSGLNYTGSSIKRSQLPVDLDGLDVSLGKYL